MSQLLRPTQLKYGGTSALHSLNTGHLKKSYFRGKIRNPLHFSCFCMTELFKRVFSNYYTLAQKIGNERLKINLLRRMEHSIFIVFIILECSFIYYMGMLVIN